MLAVCFDNPDHLGHKYGWESDEYNAMLTTLDSSIADIMGISDLAPNYLFAEIRLDGIRLPMQTEVTENIKSPTGK